MAKLTAFAAKHSLAGLDWAGGLPGTLGGAIRGNAGCFGGEIKDNHRNGTKLQYENHAPRHAQRGAMPLRLSHEHFQAASGRNHPRRDVPHEKRLKKNISERSAKKKHGARTHHPLEYPSAGSVFKNVPLSQYLHRGAKHTVMPSKNLRVTLSRLVVFRENRPGSRDRGSKAHRGKRPRRNAARRRHDLARNIRISS